MKKYSRVSYEERCQIFALLQVKKSKPEIARILGRSKSTIYRELKRVTGFKPYYEPEQAQYIRDKERSKQCKKKLITGNLKFFVESKLLERWSPEVIKGRLALESNKKLSHQTIYNHIRRNKELVPLLRFGTKRGPGRLVQRRVSKKKYLSVHDRPLSAKNRSRFGHWERDGMYAGNKSQVLVCLERKSRYVKLDMMGKVTSEKTNMLTEKLLKDEKVLSVTNDNGPEFRKHMDWNIPVYYCDPMRPDQRGSVENVIGTLRMYIDRKTDLDKLGSKGLKQIENIINLRPRKMFNYKTPFEVYHNKKVALVT